MKKLNLSKFKSSEVEVKKLLETKGGCGCVTGSANCYTSVTTNDGDARRCDTYICNP